MIEFVIEGISAPVQTVKWDHAQKDIPQFNVTVPTKFLGTHQVEDFFLSDCQLLLDGSIHTSGIVSSIPVPSIVDGNQGFTTFICDSDLGRLAIEKSANVHFQNVPVSTAISTLLGSAVESNWSLNNTSTLDDADITLDLRNKETIWSQIRAVLDECEFPTFIRYSHFATNTHFVNLGAFGEQHHDSSIGKHNLINPPKAKRSASEPIKSITATTGKIGKKPVGLETALSAQPSLGSDPNYPIVGNAVFNNTITRGLHLRVSFDIHKTKNDIDPNLSQTQQAALSVYGKCVRQIKQSNPHLTVDVLVELESTPLVDSLIYIDSIVVEDLYDAFTERLIPTETFRLQQWMRIVGIKYDFKNTSRHPITRNRTNVYTLTLTTAEERDEYDYEKYIVNHLQRHDRKDDGGLSEIIQINEVVVNHASVSPDCSQSWGDGKSFTFTKPADPGGASGVSATIIDIPAGVNYIVTQAPTLTGMGGLNFIVCVSGASNSDWTVADDITITAQFVFI